MSNGLDFFSKYKVCCDWHFRVPASQARPCIPMLTKTSSKASRLQWFRWKKNEKMNWGSIFSFWIELNRLIGLVVNLPILMGSGGRYTPIPPWYACGVRAEGPYFAVVQIMTFYVPEVTQVALYLCVIAVVKSPALWSRVLNNRTPSAPPAADIGVVATANQAGALRRRMEKRFTMAKVIKSINQSINQSNEHLIIIWINRFIHKSQTDQPTNQSINRQSNRSNDHTSSISAINWLSTKEKFNLTTDKFKYIGADNFDSFLEIFIKGYVCGVTVVRRVLLPGHHCVWEQKHPWDIYAQSHLGIVGRPDAVSLWICVWSGEFDCEALN